MQTSPSRSLVPPIADVESGYSPGLQHLVNRFKTQMGFVADSFRAYLHRPEVAEAALNFTTVLARDPSATLDRRLKRKVAFICSVLNGCRYCTAHQCSYLTKSPQDDAEAWGLSKQELERMLDGNYADESPMERACLDFARQATLDSSSISDELRLRMHQHLTAAQIVELAFVVGHWKMFNTVNDCLGLSIEDVNAAHTGWVERGIAPGEPVAR